MGIAEFIIGRAFVRPVGSTHPRACRGHTGYPSLKGADIEFQRRRGAIVLRIKGTDGAKIEGGGLIIDYRLPGKANIMRSVFSFSEIGFWTEGEGALPTKESDSK
jgi:hypothetical protein